MNTNENDEANVPSEESRVHTMLCAYVLGEATDDERGEVERLLAGSPELRAERDRLEATIGLVRTTLGGSDALPSESSEVLTRALAARQRRRWYQRPVVRLAAAAGILGLAYAGWQTSTRDVETSGFTYDLFGGDATVATAPASRVEVARSRPDADGNAEESLGLKDRLAEGEERTKESLRELGYTSADAVVAENEPTSGGKNEADLRLAAGQAGAVQAGEVLGEAFESAVAEVKVNVNSPPQEPVLLDGETLELYRYHGDLGVAAKEPTTASRRFGGKLGKKSTPGAAGGPTTPGPGGPPQRAGRLRDGPVVTGSDDFFLGRGLKGEVTGATLDETLRRLGYFSEDADGELRLNGLTSDVRAQHSGHLQRRIEFILGSCTRRPNEQPRDMFFRFWGDNPFEWTAIDALSTFSVDVDTASYALARRYLAENRLPTKAQIRTEEFVNYFDSDVPAPLESTFAIHTELAPSRFGEGPESWMLRVAVRGKDVARDERQPLTLTFVVDVSGSMKENNRMELVKHALRLLVGELDARDSIALVAFSKHARLILPMTSARHRSLIETSIHQLQPDGGTNAEAGLLMGYEQALTALAENTHNRVVLLSDGVANIGNTDQETLTRKVERHRQAGIYLNTVGVGMGNHNDTLLEQLANKGDGICNYIDDAVEARRALVERFTGAFEPIARDVKIQVEFDPQQVERYRLLGYENRAIADADFRNDAVDAGEVNAGHQVVALYELVGTPTNDAGPLATVRLRWKPPHLNGVANVDTDSASETEQSVTWGAVNRFNSASVGYRRSVLVAQFAEFLRRSTHARKDSLDQLIAEAKALDQVLEDDEFTEFVALAERSRRLVLAEQSRYDDIERALDAIQQSAYLQAQLEELNRRLGHERLYELEAAVARLAERIEWMRTLAAGNELDLTRAELPALERENARLREQVRRLLEILLDPKRRVR